MVSRWRRILAVVFVGVLAAMSAWPFVLITVPLWIVYAYAILSMYERGR